MPSIPGAPPPVRSLPGEGLAPGSRPSYNPPGGRLGADEMQLGREGEGFTVSASLGEAWTIFKNAPVQLVAMFLIIGGLGSVGWVQGEVQARTGPSPVLGLLFLVLVIAAAVVQTGLTGGAIVYWLKLIREQDARFGDLGRGFRTLLPLLVTNLIAGICILAGTLVLVVPGVVIGLGLMFVMHVVVDKNIGYIEALKASWSITRGYKVELLLLSILCSLVCLLGAVCLVVGVFVAMPVAFGAVAVAYNRLAEPGNAYLS